MDESSHLAMFRPLPRTLGFNDTPNFNNVILPHHNIPLQHPSRHGLSLSTSKEPVECATPPVASNNSTAPTAASATSARPLRWIYRLRLTPSLCLFRPLQVITPTKSRWNLRLMTSSALTKRYLDLTPPLTTRSMKPYNNLPPFPLFAQNSNGQTPFSDRLWVSCSQGRLLKKLGKSLPRESQGLGPKLTSSWSSLLAQRALTPPQIYK